MKKVIALVCLISITGLTIYYFLPEKKLPSNIKITKLIVLKSKRQLFVYSGDSLLKTYTVSLGKSPIGDKQFEGDNKTPEGYYFINAKNPNSTCYKNLGISYPDKTDIEVSKKMGKSNGGDIKIHGLPNHQGFFGKFHRFKDWTNGCIAVTNKEMDELYKSVEIGISIIIKP
jgi:murein L,D-transpeptidase YafK